MYSRGSSRFNWIISALLIAAILAIIIPIAVHFGQLNNRNNDLNSDFEQGPNSSTRSRSRTSTSDGPTETSETSETSSISPVPTGDLDDIEFDLLLQHNNKRVLHGAPNLTWNWELAIFAANYASVKLDCDNLELIHSGGPYGENLAAGYAGGFLPVNAWYDEIDLYDYDKPGFAEATGHFTQLVWNGTLEMGCAYVDCHNEWGQYTICEYQPRGNIVGQTDELTKEIFDANVARPLKDDD